MLDGQKTELKVSSNLGPDHSVEKLANLALHFAIQEGVHSPFFSLNERFLKGIHGQTEEMKKELLDQLRAALEWNEGSSQITNSLREFRLEFIDRNSESFAYHHDSVVRGILLNTLLKVVRAQTFKLADLLNASRLRAFFESVISENFLWDKVKRNFNDSKHKETFQITVSMAVQMVLDYWEPYLPKTSYQTFAIEFWKSRIEGMKRSGLNTSDRSRTLDLAEQRLNEISKLEVTEFIDRYLVDAKTYFDLFFLDNAELNLEVEKLGLESSSLESVDLKFLQSKLIDFRPTPNYKPISTQISGAQSLLVATVPLGQSKALVRRGLFREGDQKIVYKRYLYSEDYRISEFEFYFTLYANQKGIWRMPRVLHVNSSSGELIKEYVHGFTFSELKAVFGEESQQIQDLTKALALERKIIIFLTSGFDAWFRTNYPHLDADLRSKYVYLLASKDNHKDDNWIFDPLKGRWILVDP